MGLVCVLLATGYELVVTAMMDNLFIASALD